MGFMGIEALVLVVEAMAVYFLIFCTHSLRRRFGAVHFYALLGGITAMSCLTRTGVAVQVAGISIITGSAIFYTSLFFGIFIVYAFEGPRAARLAMVAVVGVMLLVPVVTSLLHLQMYLIDSPRISSVPLPKIRKLGASIIAMTMDFIFLAIAWEYLGKANLRLPFWARVFLTLLGVMWLDVLIFSTCDFAGKPYYLENMGGSLLSRFLLTVFVSPFLLGYLRWESKKAGKVIENRPVLAILQKVADIQQELTDAHQEIIRRKAAEKERDLVIEELQKTIAEVKTLRGFIPICSYCHKIRDDQGYWDRIESYLRKNSEAELSHGICPDCAERIRKEYNLAGS